MKGLDEQIEPRETRGRGRKTSRSREVLSALEIQVVNLEESMSGVKETFEVVEGYDQIKKNHALEAMVMTLKEQIAKLKGELTIYKAVLEAFFSFMDGLNPWTKQELQRRRIKELTKSMTVAESLIELIPRKDKFEYSKPKEKGNDRGDKE
ncbi:hypothetical protein J1N35_001305 [Gossypium stocksii]|uniref:Uncharacterized protein n=1 Tax=Gossypium stocksii TaxID=47602 RepID=A0A9D3WHF9_9ROSI|nr:hypothetical protein J1N35_001305 [Gossypium stocksii]